MTVRILHLAPQPTDDSGIAAYAVRYRRAVAAQPDLEIEPLDLPTAEPGSIAHVRRYVAEAARVAERFDAVHAELGGSGLREFYAARAVARRARVPVVLTAHDPPWLVWQPFHVAMVSGRRSSRALVALAGRAPARRMQRNLALRAAAVLTLSDHGSARLADTLGAAASTLPYPYEPAGAGVTAGRGGAGVGVGGRAGVGVRGGSGVPVDRGLVVGFHGYWYRGKGLEVLLDAIALTRDDAAPIDLRLWGGPPVGSGGRAGERYRAAILATVDRLGIADRVDVAGPLAAEDVPAHLGACDVVALPYEARRGTPGLASISSVAYDAYDAGTPIVASNVRALPELVDHGTDGVLVPPGDPRALAATLRALRDDPSQRETLRAGARARGAALGLDATGRAARTVYAGLPRSART